MWTRFDELSERHGIQKMETVGYTYMAVGGLLSGGQNVQAAEITRMALDCCEEASTHCSRVLQEAPKVYDLRKSECSLPVYIMKEYYCEDQYC